MANKFWTLTGIVVLALVFGAGAAIAQTTGGREHAGGQADETEGQQGAKDNARKIAQTTGEREHAGGQADETEGQQGAKDNAGKIAKTTGEREHAGGQADETEGQQGAKDNAGKANKQGKSKNNGKAGKQGQGGAANNPGANGGGTACSASVPVERRVVKQLAEWRTDTWRRGMKRRAEFPKKFTPG